MYIGLPNFTRKPCCLGTAAAAAREPRDALQGFKKPRFLKKFFRFLGF